MPDSKAGAPIGAKKVGLPPRPFLYTMDQISVMTDLSERALAQQHIYFEGRDIGVRKPHQMIARNLNQGQPLEKPDWRILDKEFIRWMRAKGYKYYETGGFKQ